MTWRGARTGSAAVRTLLLGLVACAPAPQAGEPAAGERIAPAALEANKLVVRRFYAALNAQDYAAADSLVAPGYRHYVVSDTGFRAIDWASFKAGNASARRAFPDWELTADLLVAEGEYVAVLAVGRGTHHGDFAGVPATGRSVRLPITTFHQVRGGRLVADWEVVNTEPSMRALRAGTPPSAPPHN